MMLTSATIDGHAYLRFPGLGEAAGLGHAFSTRSLNVRSGEDRATFCRAFGLDSAQLRWQQQIHEPNIALIDETVPPGPLADTDATIVTSAGQPVLAFSADCPLVLVHDSRQRVLGVAHASWRCTVAGLVERLVLAMRDRCGCRAADLRAGIGPSAGPERYEVGRDVYDAAASLPDRSVIFRPHGERWLLDLWAANRGQLERAGVGAEAIEVAGVCTMTDTTRFFSYRREGAGCGHFGLLAFLEGGEGARG